MLQQPVMFDANVFMVGISDRRSDPNCSFTNMRKLFLIPIFDSFTRMIIHEKVYQELDEETKSFVELYLHESENVQVVSEGRLYGKDPQYTELFNAISNDERVKYIRGKSKNRGEVYSLAYAAYHNINYFSSKEIMVDKIAKDLPVLNSIEIITFDIIVMISYLYYMKKEDVSNNTALKSTYKRFCEDVIRRHHLPQTLTEYVKASAAYIK